MAKMGDFIAFQAAVELIRENNMDEILDEAYAKAKEENKKQSESITNIVKQVYKPFDAEQISLKISKLLTPEDSKAEVQIIYQSIEGLHNACPNNTGDWYFTGDYPTPGGNRVANKAFINYMEGKNVRAY
jgi:amidophosphoribosyltransferase